MVLHWSITFKATLFAFTSSATFLILLLSHTLICCTVPTAAGEAKPHSRKMMDATCASLFDQCGGVKCQEVDCAGSSDSAWTCCTSEQDSTCQRQNQYYWQCLPGNATAASSQPSPASVTSPAGSPARSSPAHSPQFVSSSPAAAAPAGTLLTSTACHCCQQRTLRTTMALHSEHMKIVYQAKYTT